MMTRKEQVVNDILIGMRLHLTAHLMAVLTEVLSQAMFGVEVVEEESSLSTLDDTNAYIMELFAVRKASRLSTGTAQQYIRHVNALTDLIHKPLPRIAQSDVEYFLLCYKKRGNSNRTVNNCKRYLSAFFTWMRKARLITENPCENIEDFKETVRQIEHMEPEQWERLKTGCHRTRDRALLEFLRCTAMRGGEVPLVRISDVDWSTGKIMIYGQKSDRYRLVCIDRVARAYICDYLKERKVSQDSTEPLFVNESGNRNLGVTKETIYSSVKRIAARADMSINIYPHLIRKTTATNIIKRGGTSEDAGEYLGHAEKNTAGRYYAYKGEEHLLQIFHMRVASI